MSRSMVSKRESICSGSGAVSSSKSRNFWKAGQRLDFMLALVGSSEDLVFHKPTLPNLSQKTRLKEATKFALGAFQNRSRRREPAGFGAGNGRNVPLLTS